MAKFELYHPILTPHFTLDWLTQFKVRDINVLRQQTVPGESIIDTANYVNREMSTIMHDRALTWGVGDKQSDDFRGIVHLVPGTDNEPAQLTITPVGDDTDELVSEIQTYMKDFSNNALNCQRISLSVQ